MRKTLKIMAALAMGATAVTFATSCGSKTNESTFDDSKNITRYTRDTTSGTRDGFFTAIGLSEAKEDDAPILGSTIATDNANMISLVNNDEYGIGYISLASLEGSGLKALKYDGVEATEEAVVDGSYKLQRNFNYVTTTQDNCTETEWTLIQAFQLFTTSKEGLGIIKSKDGILTTSIAQASSWNDLLNKPENASIKTLCQTPCDAANQVEIKFGGSTSVEKIAKALSSAFKDYCPTFKPAHNHTGSGAAYKGTQGSEKNGVNKLHIGFLSRELNSNETPAANTSGMICKDGIVTVVNSANTSVTDVNADTLKNIYTGTITKWSDVK